MQSKYKTYSRPLYCPQKVLGLFYVTYLQLRFVMIRWSLFGAFLRTELKQNVYTRHLFSPFHKHFF